MRDTYLPPGAEHDDHDHMTDDHWYARKEAER